MKYENYLNEDDYKILAFLLAPHTVSDIMAKFDLSQGFVWQKTIRMEGQGLIKRVVNIGKMKAYQTVKENFEEYIDIYNKYVEQDA